MSPPCSFCPCACHPHWLLPGSAQKPPQTGPDQEARPLPALAAQGWPFPSNSTIPPLPNGTCPDTFALNRIAFESLGLPTHVKGTAGGKKQGKPTTAPAQRKKGAISRARCLHPAMTVEGGLAAGAAGATMHTPASHHSSFLEELASSSSICLFKPGLSILREMNHPEEEGFICQFIATAPQLPGDDGALEAGTEGAEGTGTAVWEHQAEPSSAGGCKGCLAVTDVLLPRGLAHVGSSTGTGLQV